jgi:peptidyl-prolyl cis-trans isomerase SurA
MTTRVRCRERLPARQRAVAGIAARLILGIAAVGGFPSPLPAQEDDTAPEIPADSIEVVDRIAAVVGDTIILYTEILETLLQARAQGAEVPPAGTPAFDSLARQTVEDLVDQLVLLQKAKQAEIRVPQETLDGETDRRFREIRNGFPSATAFQEAVQSSGRTLVQYRQFLRGQVRAQIMIDQFIRQNSENLPPVVVSEEDIQAWYKENLAGQTRPASLGFEQLVIEPQPSQEARDSARALAEVALAELRDGEEFAVVARRYSDDLSNREQGGDLGWVRRSQLVPAFAQPAWAARTGTPIGPVYTRFGYHIIKVENVRGGERKISHILIRPDMVSEDTELAREKATAVADSIRDGIPLSEMAERHGVDEIPVRVPAIPFDELEQRLGPEYGSALADPIPGELIGPFENPDLIPDRLAFVIVRVTDFKKQGDWEIDEIRDQVRERLTFDEGYRRFVEELRSEVYVDVRI